MATDYCDSSALLAATQLDRWFSDYALFHESQPQDNDKKAWTEWRLKRDDAWTNFRNACKHLAEWTEGLSDPSLDSTPLWLLSGCANYAGLGVESSTWATAWVLCNKLRSRVGTPDQAANALAIAKQIEAAKCEHEEASEPKKPVAPKKNKRTDERSWTQPELDAAICTEIRNYNTMIAAAKRGNAGAKKEVRKIFGRNHLATHLKMKPGSRGMVTKSNPWLELAKDVGLRRKSLRGAKMGLKIAMEKKADADDSTVADEVIRNETVTILKSAIQSTNGSEQKQGLTDLLEKYTLGDVTDNQARTIVATLQGY